MQPAKISVESCPVDGEFVMVKKRFQGSDGFFVPRSDGTAFASDRCDSATVERGCQSKGHLGLAQRVDKAGSNDFSYSVDGFLAARVREFTDRDDAVAANA